MIDSFSGKYRFLSNFSSVQIFYDGVWFPSVEHAYQAAKTEDRAERIRISKLPSAGAAKKAGQKLKMSGGRVADWDKRKVGVMRELLYKKFQNHDLAKMLLETGDEVLVEGNDWGDIFWGKVNGAGQNWLGKLLMEVRESIKRSVPVV